MHEEIFENNARRTKLGTRYFMKWSELNKLLIC